MEDVVTPGFSKAIAEGRIVNNPCHYVKQEVFNEDFPASCRATYNGNPTYYQKWEGAFTERMIANYGISWPTSSQCDDAAVEARAKLLAVSNINASPYAFGEDVGELKETLEFIKNPMSSMAHLADSFRKDVNRRMRRQGKKIYKVRAKAVADVWTEYRFAFSPLARSMYNAGRTLTERRPTLPVRLTSTGRFNDHVKVDGPWTSSNANYNYDGSYEESLGGHASILYEISNPIRDWRYTYGLRWRDLPTTFWQLLPLSFMVDRVVDLSSCISGLTNLADPRVKILAGSYTTRRDIAKNAKLQQFSLSVYSWTDWSANKHVEHSFEYKRALWSPSVTDAIPRIDSTYIVSDAQKILDLASLITQRLS
jgi:hypothetical protein